METNKPSIDHHENDKPFSIESPIWRIKYRPKSIDLIKEYRKDMYNQFQGYIKAKNIPHLMIVGPKGSGKTVIAEILARELLKDEFDMNFKLLFANDPIGKEERKETKKSGYISTSKIGSSAGIRKNYRPFTHMRVKPFVSTKKFGSAPFKILVIENFHDLDVEQQAFRRIIEQYSNNCRMILITDKISGIIDPIISRCQLIMVPPLKHFQFNKIIKQICMKEKISIKLHELNYLRYITKNNIGEALDLIQLTKIQTDNINLDTLTKVDKQINAKMVQGLFSTALAGNLKKMKKDLREIFRQKMFSKEEIFTKLSNIVLQSPLERSVKGFILDLIAKSDFDSIDSNNDEIQINKLLSEIAMVGKVI